MHKRLAIAFLFISPALKAQYSTMHTQMLWFNYNNTVNINTKWSIVNDVQLRTREWVSHWSQFAIRSGVSYKFNNRFAATAGFTWFGNVRYFDEEPVVANEWRPWEEISYQVMGRKSIFIQRLRLEQRFLQQVVNGKKTKDYEKRQRLRYRFEFGIPLRNKKFEIHFGDEVMGSLNYISDNRFFDQNRIFAFVNFKLSDHTFFQYQFIKIHQWQPSRNTMESQDVFRFSIHQQIQ